MYKQKTNKLDVTTLILTTLGIIVAINFFSYHISYRHDITENKDYSLSTASKQTASSLKDIVNIKAYFTSSLPSQYITLKQNIEDVLTDYANYSNGKIRFEFIDPDNDKTKEELYMLGIPEVQFNILEKDKYQVTTGYLGIAIKYGQNTEIIPVIENTANLEYDLTLAIKKATSEKMPVVGLAGEIQNKMLLVNETLGEVYESILIDLDDDPKAIESVDTLILMGISNDLSEEALIAIDNHVTNEKSLLVLADGVVLAENLAANKNTSNLHELIEKYGIKISNNLVLDKYSGFTSFSQGFVAFTLNYPLWPKIIQNGFNQEHVAVANLESVVLPWSSSLELTNNKANNKIEYLLKTSSNAWTQIDQFDLNPRSPTLNTPTEDTSEYVLAYTLTGDIQSAYSDKVTNNAKIIVVGDADFISDRYLRQNPENLIFFQNIVDYLSIDSDLIKIRSKGVTDRPIKIISNKLRQTIRYVNIFGVTFVVICFGMLRYYSRRKKQY
ncbi:GldG family protein [Patescibacteria group bacterium]|nr:GldG family protein [Patescibacteria group bacterium]